jgi:hypothetical protein
VYHSFPRSHPRISHQSWLGKRPAKRLNKQVNLLHTIDHAQQYRLPRVRRQRKDGAIHRPNWCDGIIRLCVALCGAALVVALLPALGLGFLASHLFERVFVVCAILFATASLTFGFRKHQGKAAFALLLPGVVLLVMGIIINLHNSPLLHAVLVSCGGSLVALAHLTNLRLGSAHVHDENCRHPA